MKSRLDLKWTLGHASTTYADASTTYAAVHLYTTRRW
jgi:hypothetical protein